MAYYKGITVKDCQFMLDEIDCAKRRFPEHTKQFLSTARRQIQAGSDLSFKQQQYLTDIYGRATEIKRLP